jgi:HNH endonuclease
MSSNLRDRVRFWDLVDTNGPVPEYNPNLRNCWLWRGPRDGNGYGLFRRDGKKLRPYRVAWELANGKSFPEGLVPDHLCRVRQCVRPTHVEPVTVQINTLRGMGLTAVHARKTHCIHGHEFTPENTFTNRGWRECRPCTRAYKKRYYLLHPRSQRARTERAGS